MQAQVVKLSGLPSEPCKLGANFGLGNSLLVFPAPVSQSSGPIPGPVSMNIMRWETTLYEPIFRKLVNESLHVFLNFQKMAKEEEGNIKIVYITTHYL